MKVLLSLACALVGCLGIWSLLHRPPSATLYLGIDNSEGTRHRAAYATASARLGSMLKSGVDRLVLYRVDCETREFYAGVAGTIETLLPRIVRELAHLPARPGTFPEKFWTTVADRAERSQAPTEIAYYSDGDVDNDSPRVRAALAAAAKRLAANPNVVAVVVCGIDSHNREQYRTLFAPLGDRLRLLGPDEMDPGLILEPLNAGRLGRRGSRTRLD